MGATATRTLRPRTPEVLARLALLAAIAASAFFALYPTEGSVSGIGADGIPYVHTTHTTLLDTEGPSVLLVLAVPVVLAVAAVLVRRHRVRLGLAIALMVGCLLGMMSVGLLYVPAAVLLVGAASATPQRPSMPPRPAPVSD